MFDPPVQAQNQENLTASTNVAVVPQPSSALPTRTFGASLLGFGSAAAIDCQVSKVCQDEVYVHVPLSAGLAVGQRYEVQVPDSAQAPDIANALAGCCYATVIRTDRLASSAQHELGANLRFDHPLAI